MENMATTTSALTTAAATTTTTTTTRDLLAEALELTDLTPPCQKRWNDQWSRPVLPHQLPSQTWLLSESEDDHVRVTESKKKMHQDSMCTSVRKVDPIRLNVKRKCETNEAFKPNPPLRKRKTQPEVRVDAHVVTAGDIGQRRVQLAEALEHAGKLFDELTASRFLSAEAKQEDGGYEMFRKLAIRKIMVDSLATELKLRGVLPVTMNTLSNLFSLVYLRVIR